MSFNDSRWYDDTIYVDEFEMNARTITIWYHWKGIYILLDRDQVFHPHVPAKPTADTTPTPTPQANLSTILPCHFSLSNAAAYPISGLKVTISYNEFQPRTGWPGNGSVSEIPNAEPRPEGWGDEEGVGRGMIVERRVSRCLRRICRGDKTLERISTLIIKLAWIGSYVMEGTY